MLNRVILMGRITADPELKTTNTGVSVTSFSIAVDRNYVKQVEERKADFFNIVCWISTAEFVCRYFGKGSLIAVEGQLQSRQFQAKDGSNRYVVEVVADNVSFTGERRDNNAGGYNQSYGGNQSYGAPSYGGSQAYHQEPAQQAPASYQSGSNSDFQDMPLDDDLPF